MKTVFWVIADVMAGEIGTAAATLARTEPDVFTFD